MAEIHKDACKIPYPLWVNNEAAFPSGDGPYFYTTGKDSDEDCTVIISGIAGGVAGVAISIGENKGFDDYIYRRPIPEDSDRKLAEQVEDEMIELFNSVIEAFKRGESKKSIVDCYGFVPWQSSRI